MRQRELRRLPAVPVVTPILVALALVGCKPAANEPAASAAETPPMDVTVVAVEAATVPRTLDLPGRLASTRVAEVRAQVSGIIQERAFEEGSLVKKGDVLFRIDPAVYKVQLLARQARRDEDRGERLEGRILSLSKTHDLLSREDWAGASLRIVLENELAPFRDDQVHRFGLEGADIDLPPRYVLALEMTLHELTTNAAKYGALSNDAGRIDVVWKVIVSESGARRLALEWRESGGAPVRDRGKRGFGTRLITGGVGRELGGTVGLEFAPSGLRCSLDVPLDGPDRFTSFVAVGTRQVGMA